MINDIKAKLPLKKKAKEEELDEDTEIKDAGDSTDPSISVGDKTSATDISALNGQSQTFVDKIKAKLIPKKKTTSSDDATSADYGTEIGEDLVEVKPEKKKINPVVLVIVVGALGLFLFYEPEPGPAPIALKPRKSLRTKPNDAPSDVAAPETPKENPPDTSTDTVTETPTDTTTDAVKETPADTSTDTITETPSDASTDTATETPSDTSTDTVPETPTDTSITTTTDSIDGKDPTDESTMTDKILEDLEKQVKNDQPKVIKKEYVSPPNYEYVGRGLVYNCAGKHWACVDGPSYKTCEDNFSSSTFKKKTIECYPFNIYESRKGCELMQNRVVSSNAKTAFCK